MQIKPKHQQWNTETCKWDTQRLMLIINQLTGFKTCQSAVFRWSEETHLESLWKWANSVRPCQTPLFKLRTLSFSLKKQWKRHNTEKNKLYNFGFSSCFWKWWMILFFFFFFFLCNKVLLKYKGDRESFWHRHQKGAERVPAC